MTMSTIPKSALARTALAIELTESEAHFGAAVALMVQKRERGELHLEHSLTHPAEFRAGPVACAQCRRQAYLLTKPAEQPCDLFAGFAVGVAFLGGHVIRDQVRKRGA